MRGVSMMIMRKEKKRIRKSLEDKGEGHHKKKKEAEKMVRWIFELIKELPDDTSVEDICKVTGKRYRGVGSKLLYAIVLATKEGMKNGKEIHTETIVKEIKENCYVVKPVYIFLEESGERG